jgi:hypothetical protein
MPTLTRLANLAWIAANSDGHRRFHAALADPEGTQRGLLASLIRRNVDTAFGRRHGFSGISTVDELQERVRLSTWDD